MVFLRSAPLRSSGRHALALALIALAGLLCYSNSLDAPFTFDDRIYVLENPAIKDLGFFLDTSKADARFMENVVKRYLRTRYAAYLSFWADYKLSGIDEKAFHITNLAIHLSSAALLYGLVLMTFKTPALAGAAISGRSGAVALFSALVFVTHPVQTEAVTYISQRFASLAGMFYLGALTAYARSRLSPHRRGRRVFYAAALLSALLAMKTKELSFTLPFALALYELLFFGGSIKKRALLLAPFLAASLLVPLEYVREGLRAGDVGAMTRLQTDMPRHEYLFTQMRVVATYIRLVLLPVNQNFDYDYPIYTSFSAPPVYMSFIFLLCVFSFGAALLFRSGKVPALRLVFFGMALFFLSLSVESSVIPISEVIYEYRLYLAVAGAAVAAVTAVFVASKRLRCPAVLRALAMAPLLLSVLTYSRNSLWADNVALYEDTIKKSPLKARAHLNLGAAYEGKQLHDKAEEYYLKALSLRPNDVTAALAYHNLGTIYESEGLYEKAEQSYFTAMILDPNNPKVYSGLGIVYERMGKNAEARKQYLKALDIDSSDAVARYNLAKLALKEKDGFEDVEQMYRSALDADPALAEARYGLAVAYEKQGRTEEAIAQYLAALETRPNFAEAHYNLGVIYHRQGLADKAEDEYRAAIEAKPEHAASHNNLGLLLAEKGLFADALEEFRKASELRPDDEEIRMNLELAKQKAR